MISHVKSILLFFCCCFGFSFVETQAMHIPAVSKKKKIDQDAQTLQIMCQNLQGLINSYNQCTNDPKANNNLIVFGKFNVGAALRRIILVCKAHSMPIYSVISNLHKIKVDTTKTAYSLLLECYLSLNMNIKAKTKATEEELISMCVHDLYKSNLKLQLLPVSTPGMNPVQIGNNEPEILIDGLIDVIRSNDAYLFFTFLEGPIKDTFKAFILNQPNINGFYLIQYAVFFNNIPIVKKLIEMKANINPDPKMPIWDLVRSQEMHDVLSKSIKECESAKQPLNAAQQLALEICQLNNHVSQTTQKESEQVAQPASTTSSATSSTESSKEKDSITAKKEKDISAPVDFQSQVDDGTKEKKMVIKQEIVSPDFELFVLTTVLHTSTKVIMELPKTDNLIRTLLKKSNYNSLLQLIQWYQKNNWSIEKILKTSIGDQEITNFLKDFSSIHSCDITSTIRNFFNSNILFNNYTKEQLYFLLIGNLIKAGLTHQVKKWLPKALEEDMSLDYLARDQASLLMTAVLYDQRDIVDFLLQNKANVNERHQGIAPLMLARTYEMQHHLLRAKADINHKNEAGETPLISSAKVACTLQLKALLAYEPIPDLQKIEAILNERVHLDEVDNNGKTALHWFLEKKDFDEDSCNVVKDFILKGASLNIQDNHGITPYMVAADNKNWRTLEFMVQSSAVSPYDLSMHDDQGRTLLTMMHGALRSFSGQRANPQVPQILRLLSIVSGRGAQVNEINSQGYTALMIAVKNCDLDQVGLLFACKVDPSIVHKVSNKTALTMAQEEYVKTKKDTYQSIIGLLKKHTKLSPEMMQKRKEIEENAKKTLEKIKQKRLADDAAKKMKDEQKKEDQQKELGELAKKLQEEEKQKKLANDAKIQKDKQENDVQNEQEEAKKQKKNKKKLVRTKVKKDTPEVVVTATAEHAPKEKTVELCTQGDKCKKYLLKRILVGPEALRFAKDAYKKHGDVDLKDMEQCEPDDILKLFVFRKFRHSPVLKWYVRHLKDETCKSCVACADIDRVKILEEIKQRAMLQNDAKHTVDKCGSQ